jgi:hypothetical protein
MALKNTGNKIANWIINNPVSLKLAENAVTGLIIRYLARLFAESPNDLKYLQALGWLITAWVGLPMTLTQFGLAIPSWLPHFEDKTTLICTLIGIVLVKFGVKDPAVLVPKPVGVLQTIPTANVANQGQTTHLDAALQDFATKNSITLEAATNLYNTDPTTKKAMDAAYGLN